MGVGRAARDKEGVRGQNMEGVILFLRFAHDQVGVRF